MNKRTFIWSVIVLSMAFALYQAFLVAPHITEQSPYSDALIYMDMAQFELAYGPTHITHRVLLPSLAGIFNSILFFWSTPYTLPVIFALFNVALFTLGMSFIWEITFRHHRFAITFPEVMPLYLLLGVPVVWRSAFLPMADTAAFFTVALMLFSFVERNLLFLLIGSLLAIWLKEIALLIIIVFPLIDWGLERKWFIGYFPPVFAILLYCGLTYVMISGDTSSYYLFNISAWVEDWSTTFKQLDFVDLTHLLSAFGLLLPYYIYRVFTGFQHKHVLAGAFAMAVLFFIFWMFTPSNSPRLMFAVLPLSALLFKTKS